MLHGVDFLNLLVKRGVQFPETFIPYTFEQYLTLWFTYGYFWWVT